MQFFIRKRCIIISINFKFTYHFVPLMIIQIILISVLFVMREMVDKKITFQIVFIFLTKALNDELKPFFPNRNYVSVLNKKM